MSAHTREHPINQNYKIIIKIPGKKTLSTFVPKEHFSKLEAFLEKYGQSESTPWHELAATRISKYTKAGIALKGARYREELSQKALSEKTNISQNNISKMENGQRPIGEKVAKKLAKALNVPHQLFLKGV